MIEDPIIYEADYSDPELDEDDPDESIPDVRNDPYPTHSDDPQ